jgi:hypothetical protein
MKAAVWLVVLLCATAANAKESHRDTPLPVPPIPPSQPPPMAAPLPDLDAPVPDAVERQSPVTLYTDINHRVSPSLGSGFAPGARYQTDTDRRLLYLPGIMLHLPFP